ncbi:MAG: Sua5/YciO/YrdC/YwlC family protein [Thermomicrobiales bacterium]|nr:Sua5/YciO/YrdC/YwlC family protein [Thermomicrobiales bacterium]
MSSRTDQIGTVAADSGVDAEVVARAARALRAGLVIAIPTDTVYGLAAAVDRPEAIERLYAIKGRPEEKAIPVLISNPENLARLSPHFSAMAARLARTFWPGALTLVLPALPDLPQRVTDVTSDGLKTVAIRMPGNALARAIIAAAGGALAVTSANRSGAAPAVEAREVDRFALSQPLLVIDGGRAPGGVPSTIVLATSEQPEILREGAIPASAIAKALAGMEAGHGEDVGARYDPRVREQERNGVPKETR